MLEFRAGQNLLTYKVGQAGRLRLIRVLKQFTMIRMMTDIRAIRPGDRQAIACLMSGIDDLYPDGSAWLDRRIDDILLDRAVGLLASCSGSPAGLAINTPKGFRRHKLSTIYVAPWARNRAVGSKMLVWLNRYWAAEKARDIYVTFDSRNADLAGFFRRRGFDPRYIDRDRYGSGRSEAIFAWNPSFGDELASARH